MLIEGTIVEIKDTVEVSDKFSKREVWIETKDNGFTQTNALEFIKEKCAVLDKFNIGDVVKVEFNLNGRVWDKNGRKSCFNTLQGWKIDLIKKGNAVPAGGDPSGDLPF